MGRQIIKQPNGKYSVFSTVVDGLIYADMTEEDLVEAFIAEERKTISAKVRDIINQLEEGGKPYFQFTMDAKDTLETIKRVHGAESDEYQEALQFLVEDNNELDKAKAD